MPVARAVMTLVPAPAPTRAAQVRITQHDAWRADLARAMLRPAPMTTDIVRRYVDVTDGRLSYLQRERAADGPTILLIHGSGMSARYWMEQLRGLAVGARIVALDLPGHGGSHDRCATSVEDYGRITADFVDALGARPVIAVGHSLGGAVALALTAHRPANVRGLVLLSTCARLPAIQEPAHLLLPFLPAMLRKLIFFATAKNLLFSPGASRRAIGLGMQELRGCRAETIANDVAIARTMDVSELARRVRVPTLVLCGARDRLTPPALSEELHRLITGSRLAVVERAGHMVLVEAPAVVNGHIETFIAAIGGPTVARRVGAERARRGRTRLVAARLRGAIQRAWDVLSSWAHRHR